MDLTNEQKLLILLQKAVENGYVDNQCLAFDNFHKVFTLQGVVNSVDLLLQRENDDEYESLNDLVLNFEPNKIDFIEALFTALINEVEDVTEVRETYTGQFKLQFISLPTKDRLNYLFQTFKTLLK